MAAATRTMGNCFGGGGKNKVNDGVVVGDGEQLVTVAFPDIAPVSVVVHGSETLGQVRDKVRALMAKRASDGNPTAAVAGVVMTMRGNGGDAVQLADTTTVRRARLEPRQYIWFHDQREEDRVRAVVLRASRLTDDVAKNSRGVKKGMRLVLAEEKRGSSA